MSSTTLTLPTASTALASLLSRRRKRKQISSPLAWRSSSSTTTLPTTTLPTTTLPSRKKRKASTTSKVVSEEEELHGSQKQEEERVRANVRILKELGKVGKKERKLRDEILQIWKERELARKGKGKKVEQPVEGDEDSD